MTATCANQCRLFALALALPCHDHSAIRIECWNLRPVTGLLAPAEQLACESQRHNLRGDSPGSITAVKQSVRRCTDVITSTCLLVIGLILERSIYKLPLKFMAKYL